MRCSSLAVGLLVVLGGLLARPDPSRAESPTDAQILRWVTALGDDQFAKREEATRKLRDAGRPAVTPLARAAVGDDPEVTRRAVEILAEISQSDVVDAAKTAHAALGDIAGSKHPAARRARVALQARV